MKIVVLYSGGIDSLALYHLIKNNNPNAEIKAIYYDIGSGENSKEIQLLPDFVEVRKIDWLNTERTAQSIQDKQIGNYFVPGRNAIFAQLAAFQELPDKVVLGVLYGEEDEALKDRHREFIKRMEYLVNYVIKDYTDKDISFEMPLVDYKMDKINCIEYLLDNDVPKNIISRIPTCFSYEHFACGNCSKCTKLALAQYYTNTLDLSVYNENPLTSEFAISFIHRCILQFVGRDKVTSEGSLKWIIRCIKKMYNDGLLIGEAKKTFEDNLPLIGY